MNNFNPSVDILIACYNGEKYINRCLNSVLNQTYKNISIIIVNDGSTDNSKKIIKEYSKNNKNIKLINQENKGLAKTRNILLDNAKSNYIYFLDVDDFIDNNCIENMINALDGYNDAVVAPAKIINKNKIKEFYITNKIKDKYNIEKYLISNTIFAWNILIRRELFNNIKFYDEYSFFEDCGIMTYLLYKYNNVKIIDKANYNYIIYKDSLSHSSKMRYKRIYSSLMQLNNLYNLIKQENFKKLPKCLNDQLAFYHCVVFTYIQFQSDITKQEKKSLKKQLKNLEKNNWKLHFPRRYWKFWYFFLYRLFGY